ncbi:dihydrolipoyl dehydrogenase family protein [Jannaschia sp. CCS1]|uniref:dihydrolipoyl dehydrogenase family protein n=1 Tax=Jannaschia sp. (strain CCS1) TaxID=290400 RepID=UPI000053DA5C|nr:FAD-dependent oxidoreductase [Jannaschia sp. CCS1]ABD54981.1 FAD-dependent pyridine nucleotide-disulfide oxidoreductase [Jannaschia sp. CCS1]
MSDTSFDAIVIGAGSGGLSFGQTAAKLGARVAVIEKDRLGGTCVNRGCVPKKLMWTLAHAVKQSRELATQGILEAAPAINMATFRTKSDAHVNGIVDSFNETLDDAGVAVFRGSGLISAPGEITLGEQILRADKIVVATGGRPARPDIDGAELCKVSDDILAMTDLPDSIVVVGGGYIGCEFASILAGLGVDVTLVSDGDAVLTEFSAPLQILAEANLKAQGCSVVLNARPQRVERSGDTLRVTLEDGSTLDVADVLLATGRAPNLDVLGALAEDVNLSDSGQIDIDDGFATSVPNLFAIGDCTTRLPLTPVATDDGRVLALNLFGGGADPVATSHIATTAFLMPPLAEVGATDDLAKGTDFQSLSEGVLSSGQKHAWHVALDGDQITGLAFAADGAGEAAGFMAQIVAAEMPRKTATQALPVHPSSSEEIFDALKTD